MAFRPTWRRKSTISSTSVRRRASHAGKRRWALTSPLPYFRGTLGRCDFPPFAEPLRAPIVPKLRHAIAAIALLACATSQAIAETADAACRRSRHDAGTSGSACHTERGARSCPNGSARAVRRCRATCTSSAQPRRARASGAACASPAFIVAARGPLDDRQCRRRHGRR